MESHLPTSTRLDLVAELETFKINRVEFAELLEGAFSQVPNSDLIDLKLLEILNLVFSTKDDLLSGRETLNIVEQTENKAAISLAKRVILAGIILRLSRSEDASATDLRSIWPMLYSAINEDSELPLIASLGAQGFLSIPFYFKGKGSDISSILRLHFWHKSMFKDLERNHVQSSIHSHRFHATSWILKGHITDYSYNVSIADYETDYCFFDLKWETSTSARLDENKSFIKNNGIFADLGNQIVHTYQEGQSYETDCGVFHSSYVEFPQEDSLLSTLFLFDAQKGIIKSGGVVGPANIEREETIRHPFTDEETYQLIESLNELIKRDND